jgi:hypothetical protein
VSSFFFFKRQGMFWMFNMQDSVVFQLDTALKSRDLDQAKKLIEENPALQEHINKKLYTVVKAEDTFFHALLTAHETREAHNLLFLGADPNYRTDSKNNLTLLEKAVLAGDLSLTMMLLEQDANPLRDPIETLADLTLEKNKNFMAYQGHSLPIQRAYEKFRTNCFDRTNNEIFDLLSEAVLIAHGKELEEQFKSIFEQVIDEIKKAKEAAKTENKRLMILIGEDHHGLNSLVIESMAYLVAKELGINTVLTEQDQKMLDHFNKTGKRLTRANQWGAIINFLNIVKENKGEIVPIDIEQTKLLEEGIVGTSAEDVALRDKIMAQCANQVKSDVVCVVGDGHLYGLLNKTDLESNFYVLPISTTIADYKKIQKITKNTMTLEAFDKQSHQVKSREFNTTFPEKVKNLTVFQDAGYQSLMSPDKAIAIVYKLFEECQPKLNGTVQETKSDSPRPTA